RRLGDFAFGLRRGRNQLAAFTVEPSRFTLERSKPGELDQILFPKLAHARQLSLDECNFLGLRILLRGEAGNLLPNLGVPLPHLRLLAAASRLAQAEKLAFAIHRLCTVGITLVRD